MKKTLLLLLLAPAALFAQTNGLTLAELRTKVLAGNPSVEESLQRIEAADAVLKQVRSSYLPTITATASYGLADMSLHPDTSPTVRVNDSFMQSTAGLEANWILFNGFARRAQHLSARYRLEQTREMAEETNRLLIQAATVAFRQAQLAQQNIEIAEQDYSFNKELEDDARKRFNAGALPESDVHNFSIRALQAESAALQAQLNLKTASTVLVQLMALPEEQLPENMAPVAIEFEDAVTAPTIEEEYDYALSHRPDFKAAQSGVRALEQQLRASKGSLAPTVALNGSVNYTEREQYMNSEQHGNYDSFVGVVASWDLFTGGRKTGAIQQASAEMLAAKEQQESLRLSIRSSLRQKIDSAEIALIVFNRQEQILHLSEQVRESVGKSYKAGMVSITRLNEAQTDLVSAHGAYTTSYIAYRLILNEIDLETGRILEEM